MAKGFLLTSRQMEAIREVVRRVTLQHLGTTSGKPRQQRQRNLTGKLDGDLAVATAFADGPSTATMSVWAKNSDGDMADTGDNITVTNRLLYVSIPSGTIVEAHWIDGEWRCGVADCEST